MLADIVDHVIGIDPDRDQITASLVEASTGGELATEAFETTRGGYERLVAWADSHTSRESRAWAVEGSGSYGSGACAHLSAAREQVIEFSHPRTAATSDGAKTDALDARRAAREVLGRPNLAVPRARGRREALRALESTRRGAQTARTAAINELKALIISAPVDLRDQLRGLTTAAQVAKCAAFRLPAAPLDELTATKQALRSLARRIKTLTAEAAELQTSIRGLVEAVAPTCSTSPASDPSPPRRSTSPGHTPAAAATKQHSPASPASPHSKHPPGRTPATASTAAATANSTAPCTPSPSPAAATAPTPRPTSPNEPPKAKPPEKPNAASNATSPARSTASSNTPKSTLDKHRSIVYAKAHFLGYTFRGRLARGRRGFFVSFSPAMSPKAKKAIGKQIRDWHLNRRSATDLAGLARAINARIRGWFNYYGAFYRLRVVFHRSAHRRTPRPMGDAEVQTIARPTHQSMEMARRCPSARATTLRSLAPRCFNPTPDCGSRMTGDCHVRF